MDQSILMETHSIKCFWVNIHVPYNVYNIIIGYDDPVRERASHPFFSSGHVPIYAYIKLLIDTFDTLQGFCAFSMSQFL